MAIVLLYCIAIYAGEMRGKLRGKMRGKSGGNCGGNCGEAPDGTLLNRIKHRRQINKCAVNLRFHATTERNSDADCDEEIGDLFELVRH